MNYQDLSKSNEMMLYCLCLYGREFVGESSKGTRLLCWDELVSGCVGFGISAVTVVWWDCWWDCTVLWDGSSEVPAVDVVVAVELLLM